MFRSSSFADRRFQAVDLKLSPLTVTVALKLHLFMVTAALKHHLSQWLPL